MFISGLFSWMSGQDVSWDLLNYHLYNPYAFLTGRLQTDIMPAGIHTFLNPLLDIPLFLLIKYFNAFPQLIAFIQGLWGGALGFVVYKISQLVFPQKEQQVHALLACAIGLTGSMLVSQMGLSYNEVPMAFFLCLSFYWLLVFLLKEPHKIKWVFWSAFIAGAAGGLKYTGAPFVLGLTVAFFINLPTYQRPLKTTCLFALGGITGFLLTNGYFIFHYYVAYRNPLFPFFNNFFQSPYFDPVNFDEVRFYPRHVWQWLFYPFFWIFPNQWVVSEPIVADARLALAQLSFLVLLPAALTSKLKAHTSRCLVRALLAFCAVGFILWMNFYGILRYLVTLEALSGFLIVLALRQFFSNRLVTVLVLIILTGLACHTIYPDWGREMYSKHAIEITPQPQVEKNALVLLVGSPTSFIAPFFPKDTRFIGGIKLPVSKFPQKYWSAATQRYPLTKLYYAYHFEEPVQQTIHAHTGPIYLLTIPWDLMLDPLFLEPLGLKASAKPCQDFDTNLNIYVTGYTLCPLEKMGPEDSQ